MSVRRLATDQPESFAFNETNAAWAEKQITQYPADRKQSAIIPLLWRAQEQNNGWVSESAIRMVADMLEMPYIRALEVATFYTMFQLQPVGAKAHIQVCGTTPCMLRGSKDLIRICQSRIAQKPHEVSQDGTMSWEEVECLGACVNAPMVQIFKDTYEDLTSETFAKLLDDIAAGHDVIPGPQNGRRFCMNEEGATSLTELKDLGPKGGDPTGHRVDGHAAAGTVMSGVSINGGAQPKPVKPFVLSAGAKVKKPIEELPKQGEKSPVDDQMTKADKAGQRPHGYDGPKGGQADDLKRISGIERVNEDKLNTVGIYHFEQIAGWEQPQIDWVSAFLSFVGRIENEGWVEQAKLLAKGEQTSFSKRVDKGDVPSSTQDKGNA